MKIAINRILLDMPPFCRMFFFGREQKLAVKTLHNCSFVIRQFFNFLSNNVNNFNYKNPVDFSIADLDSIPVSCVELYIKYLSEQNTSGSIGQQIYTLNSFFKYFCKISEISHNPISQIDIPERKEKPIIRLNKEETKQILATIDSGYRKENGKRRLGSKHLLRDKTILTLFLSTGIRLSELVGLDYNDINLDNASFRVRRKGGKQEICYMPVSLVEQLKTYLHSFPKSRPDEPLFMSIYNKRASTASIQALVKNYCKVAGIKRKITPHKLHSTFGTNVYEQTRDIYLVADLLGHKDVRTTTTHYTTVKESLKREALNDFQIV